MRELSSLGRFGPVKLSEIVALLHEWYPPDTADDWDAVGLVAGDPEQPIGKVLFAVDPTQEVADEAAQWGADLLVVHHPLFLRPVHGVALTTPKARTLGRLTGAGCALLTAHTNADLASSGVSESLASALGLADLQPIIAREGAPATGTGRIGTIAETSLGAFAEAVSRSLPGTAAGVRVAGDPSAQVRRVAVCGGAGDFLLDKVAGLDVDVYVTSDLRHHPAAEFRERGGPALIDVAHWAAEWTWLPVAAARLGEAMGDRLETRVSRIVTDPWTIHLATPKLNS